MPDTNKPFMFAGFIVGMDTSTQTLSIRPSNVVVDKKNTRYGIAINKSQGFLINFVKDKNFINFKYENNQANLEKFLLALQNRGKVWLEIQKKQNQARPKSYEYFVINLSWEE